MHAAHHKHHEVAKLLADHGADVSLRAKNGSNAFDIAHLTRECTNRQCPCAKIFYNTKFIVSNPEPG